jgi:nucleotide-binding universal stress UspA family protein
MSEESTPAPCRPVLAAIDLSAHSQAVLEFAADIAHWVRAPLKILHVIHEPASAPGFYRRDGESTMHLPLSDLARRMLMETLDQAREKHPHREALRTAHTLLVEGLPAPRILEMAELERAAMIVMSSHGRTRLSRLVLGSVAEEVSRRSQVPVTIVKSSWPGWEPEPLLSEAHRDTSTGVKAMTA